MVKIPLITDIYISIYIKLFKFEYGQIICTHRPCFLMQGHKHLLGSYTLLILQSPFAHQKHRYTCYNNYS